RWLPWRVGKQLSLLTIIVSQHTIRGDPKKVKCHALSLLDYGRRAGILAPILEPDGYPRYVAKAGRSSCQREGHHFRTVRAGGQSPEGQRGQRASRVHPGADGHAER